MPTPESRHRDDVTGRAATVNARKAIKVERTVRVRRPAPELYRLWRDFANLPRFMRHVESVRCPDDRHSHWVARISGGKRVEWDAEIVNDIDGKLIAWKTVGDPDIAHAGSVHFTPVPSGVGADVKIELDYEPPFARMIGEIAAHLGLTADSLVDDDLLRFKEYAESDSPVGDA